MRRARTNPGSRARGTGAVPVTVTRPELLIGGSDRAFRRLIYDLHSLFRRMDRLRDRLGAVLGLTGNQFHILMVIAELQNARAVNISAVAAALHTSGTYVTKETGALERRRFVRKAVNPRDRREVLVTLTEQGRAAIRRIARVLRPVNDALFLGVTTSHIGGFRRTVALMLGNAVAATARAGRR